MTVGELIKKLQEYSPDCPVVEGQTVEVTGIDQPELLEMALAGYALKRADVERQIERVRIMLAMEYRDCPVCIHPHKIPIAKREKSRKGGRR